MFFYLSLKYIVQDLQRYLDEASEGVIYFSLGSNVFSNRMPLEKRNMFIEAFSELPQKVLWKWESDTLPGKPPNVRVQKWLPQQDVLGKISNLAKLNIQILPKES